VRASDYHGWIREGLALFDALIACDVAVLEVFPTASRTRWQGGGVGKAAPPRHDGVWRRSSWRGSRHARIGISAAVTARLHTLGMTAPIGDIVVPTERRSAAEVGAPP
jgi:predicted nuclease with RNAse H fold